MSSGFVDTNALAYSGRAPRPDRQAARTRRWGWWYQAEWRLAGMKAYWSSALGYAVLTPILYLIAMGIGLGTLVDAGSGGVEGVPYLTFVAPGLLVSSVVMAAAGETTFPVVDGFKWGKLYYARSATAASAAQVALGEIVAIALKFAGISLIFWLVLLVAGVVGAGSWPIVVVAVLAGLSFGTPLMAYAATIENEGYQFAMVQRFIINPMFLFAGTFFPLESMPVFLRWIGWISPMWHGTQLARLLAFGLAVPWGMVLVHLAFLLVLAGGGAVLAVRNFTRRLAR
ncbi:ABC transporter permease [Propionicimonas sp.]|uniref:ABC transporter permease n=1 Tax=Propionicimonas sp. TaxID=1955623 RepID=UPI0039E545E9